MRRSTGVENVFIINDMEAHAYGLGITPEYFEVKEGSSIAGNAAILSPGTGLGECGLFWDENYYHPFSTEGGHCSFSPETDLDIELMKFLRKQQPHVSWERIISGPGIFSLYKFLKEFRNYEEPSWLTDNFRNDDPAGVINKCSRDGSSVLCKEVIALFLRYLAREAAQVALKFKATGGIFIGGGILPKLTDQIDKQEFKKNFINSGPMNPLLNLIPVRVILNPDTAIYGAAIFSIIKLVKENLD